MWWWLVIIFFIIFWAIFLGLFWLLAIRPPPSPTSSSATPTNSDNPSPPAPHQTVSSPAVPKSSRWVRRVLRSRLGVTVAMLVETAVGVGWAFVIIVLDGRLSPQGYRRSGWSRRIRRLPGSCRIWRNGLSMGMR